MLGNAAAKTRLATIAIVPLQIEVAFLALAAVVP